MWIVIDSCPLITAQVSVDYKYSTGKKIAYTIKKVVCSEDSGAIYLKDPAEPYKDWYRLFTEESFDKLPKVVQDEIILTARSGRQDMYRWINHDERVMVLEDRGLLPNPEGAKKLRRRVEDLLRKNNDVKKLLKVASIIGAKIDDLI